MNLFAFRTKKGLLMEIEKRLFKRYPIPEDTLYVFCEDSSVKGWVRDISSGGIGFGYFSIEDNRLDKDIKLILAGTKVNIYIPDIKCKTIYDQPVKNHTVHATGAAGRRCGVQFGKLSAATKVKLEEVMEERQPP